MIAIGAAGTSQAPHQEPNLGIRIDGYPVAIEDVQMLEEVRPGDRVTIMTPHGQSVTGKCVMKFDAHAVLNLGGKHGRPGIADARNILKVKTAR